MTGPLRSLWRSPSPLPPPPARVWRDWVLLLAVPAVAVLEGLLRTDLPFPVLSVTTVVAIAPTLLWRRSHPLLMLVLAFVPLQVVAAVIGDTVQVYAAGFLLLLPYALIRWGSGRSIALGLPLVALSVVLSGVITGDLAELLGGLVVVGTVGVLGWVFRLRSTGRRRELERVRMLEREQLARDLHDTVAHHVSAIAIRAQAGLAMSDRDPGAAADALGIIESEASTTLAEMRGMVRVLRTDEDALLAPGPGVDDIRALADAGPPLVRVEVDGDQHALPPTVAGALYRIAQESVTNARRHARKAALIDVRIVVRDDAVVLSVRDDGDPRPSGSPGFGLVGMRERAALLGGSCMAGPGPTGGWLVEARLPRTGWAA